MRKHIDTVSSVKSKMYTLAQDDSSAEARGRDSYEEGRRIANAWGRQARKLLGLDDDAAVRVGLAARILYEIGVEFLPALNFDRPVPLNSQWEGIVGLEKLYAKGCHLPDKLRSLFGDAYGANLLDIIRNGALVCGSPEMSRMFSGCDDMAAIVPPRPSAVALLTVLSVTREWGEYLRKLTEGFAGLAEWVSRCPSTVERMCRLLVHGYLLASSLLECVVLFEYAAWRSKQVAKRPPDRKPDRQRKTKRDSGPSAP